MSYEFHGEIRVSDMPDDEDAIAKAVFSVISDQDYDDDAIAITEEVDYSENYMYYYCGGLDEDTADTLDYFFCSVTNKIVELYPDCSMYSHICDTEMSSDMEFVYTVQLRNRQVKELDLENSVGMIECPNPECENGLVTWGEMDFDREYDCDECGRHVTVDEMNTLVSEYVEEYDVTEFKKRHPYG